MNGQLFATQISRSRSCNKRSYYPLLQTKLSRTLSLLQWKEPYTGSLISLVPKVSAGVIFNSCHPRTCHLGQTPVAKPLCKNQPAECTQPATRAQPTCTQTALLSLPCLGLGPMTKHSANENKTWHSILPSHGLRVKHRFAKK